MTTDADTAAPSEPPDDEQHPRPRRRRWLLIAALLALAIVVVAVWVVYGGERAQPTSEDEARKRLGAAAGATVPATPVPAAGDVLVAQPAAGLYRYTGGGEERTSVPPVTEQLGPDMPATVVPTEAGCWVFHIDYNTHHWDETRYCVSDGRLVEHGGSTFTRRVFGTLTIDNTETFTCDPVPLWQRGDAPGTTRQRTCTGSGTMASEVSRAHGVVTVVGPDQIDVGGARVPVMHVRYEVTLSEAQTGNATTDLWFLLSTGLPVRNERRVSVTTSSPVGEILYTEDGWYELTSLRPA